MKNEEELFSRSRLTAGLDEAGIPWSSRQVDLLIRYAREIAGWNEKINLVGDPDIIGRHILDSAAGYHHIKVLSPKTVCDVGTGAGLPGIPLAVLLPETRFCLNDKMGRRVGFLRNMLPLLGLSSRVSLLNCPVEEVTDHFDLVTVRAFKAVPACLPVLFPLLNEDGHVAAYLGSDTLAEGYRCDPLEYSFLKGKRHLGIISYSEIKKLIKHR